LIPFRDTLDAEGPVKATIGVILAYLVLAVAGQVPHLNFWQILVALAGLWIFGAYLERRLGSLAFLAIYILLAGSTGFLVASIDGQEGAFAVSIFLPVLALAGLHLALAPRSRILCLLPIPFAMSFFEVPTIAMAVGWVGLEMLLTAA
jgi:membrane associated rhomboid family serine protease